MALVEEKIEILNIINNKLSECIEAEMDICVCIDFDGNHVNNNVCLEKYDLTEDELYLEAGLYNIQIFGLKNVDFEDLDTSPYVEMYFEFENGTLLVIMYEK